MPDWRQQLADSMTPEDYSNLSKLRKRVDKDCAVCGEPMKDVLKKTKFCSNRCKQKDKYQRSKAKK